MEPLALETPMHQECHVYVYVGEHAVGRPSGGCLLHSDFSPNKLFQKGFTPSQIAVMNSTAWQMKMLCFHCDFVHGEHFISHTNLNRNSHTCTIQECALAIVLDPMIQWNRLNHWKPWFIFGPVLCHGLLPLSPKLNVTLDMNN